MKASSNNTPSILEASAKPIIFGLIVGGAIITLLFILFAIIISFSILPLSSATIVSSIAISIGAFFTGFTSAKKLTKNGLIIGIISSFILFLLFTIIGIAAFKTAPGTPTLIRLLIFITSGAIGGIIGVGNSDKRKIQY